MNIRNLYRCLLKGTASYILPPEWTGSQLFWELKNKLLRMSGIKIGHHAGIDSDFTSVLGCEEMLELGDHSGMAPGIKVINLAPIKIGAGTTFAAGVTLATGGPGVPERLGHRGRGMNIGRGCWIGNGATLIGEISVGDHVVIGAGAMVMEDIPDGAVVVGVPARVIRFRNLPARVWFTPDLSMDTKTFEMLPHGATS